MASQHAQATALIDSPIKVQFAQAQALLNQRFRMAQAQARIGAVRISQSTTETTYVGNPNALISQSVTETALTSNPNAVISQSVVEIVFPRYAHAVSQAQALILSSTFSVVGQSNALIVKSAGYAQAQAWIGLPAWVNAQAQSVIQITSVIFAQSQALIESTIVTSTAYAQAQAQIQQTYLAHSQAQAHISVLTFTHAQAQAQIRAVARVHAQALATIKRANRGFAQARPRIKAEGVNRVAQAQARISKSAGYANARAWIEVTNNRSAQAQATLATRSWQHAQSNAMVRGIGKPTAQAIAWIDTPFRFAQAKAQIRNGDKVIAQAKAYVIKPEYKYAQAQATIKAPARGYGQAQALLNTGLSLAQAQAQIKSGGQAYAQAQGFITKAAGFAQAMARMSGEIVQVTGQAQGRIKTTYRAHAQALGIIEKQVRGYAQAHATIEVTSRYFGAAQAYILNGQQYAQAGARIINHPHTHAQAQSMIHRFEGYAQAKAYIKGETGDYLVRYNGHYLPGYAQEESFDSSMRINAHDIAYGVGSISEYTGLQNKVISLRFKVLADDFATAKIKMQRGVTILRSSRAQFAQLYINRTDRYYLAKPKSIKNESSAKTNTRMVEYSVEFEAKPWEYGSEIYTVSGSTSIVVPRTVADGGWTPAKVLITGTDVVVSGYTSSEFAGYISVSGTITNLEIDSEAYTASVNGVNKNGIMRNLDYAVRIGPSTTYFTISGATSVIITYSNRWY